LTAIASVADLIPTQDQVRDSRALAGLSQRQSATLIHVSRRSWQCYEDGTAKMKLGLWELFQFKTGQIWVKPAALQQAKKPSRHQGRAANLKPFKAKASAGVGQ
jgi:predicted transcriptional regulator